MNAVEMDVIDSPQQRNFRFMWMLGISYKEKEFPLGAI
jgi:hypothetical protein